MLKKIFRVITGEIFSEDFILKNFKLIFLITALTLVFITNRFACNKKMTSIEKLRTELKDIRYENLMLQTEVTTRSRQSQIEQKLREKGISLTSSKKQVFEIEK